MPSPIASIPARSERQALDWSLVLASQGIDTTIEREPEAGTWQLRVPGPDYHRAVRAIRDYLQENRNRRWHQELPFSDLILDWRSVVPMLFFVLVYGLEATGHGALRAAGRMDNEAVRSGEWWRLFTAVTLHGDPVHLAANTVTGLLLVGLAMGSFGAGLGMLAPFLAGVLGNLAGFVMYGRVHQSLGASGMILGALGLLAAQSFILFRRGLAPKFLAVRGALSGCLLLILLGLNPEETVDLVAHVAGFVAGLTFGATLAWLPPSVLSSPWTNRLCLAGCVGVLALPWWLALRAPHV